MGGENDSPKETPTPCATTQDPPLDITAPSDLSPHDQEEDHTGKKNARLVAPSETYGNANAVINPYTLNTQEFPPWPRTEY